MWRWHSFHPYDLVLISETSKRNKPDHFHALKQNFCFLFCFVFFPIVIHSMQGGTATTRHGVSRKRSTTTSQHIWNLFRKNLQLKMSVNSRLKSTKIIGQRKAFKRQRIPESSCARKETVDIVILVTYRNDDRKIMQSIRITSRPTSRKRKWNQLSQLWRTSTKVIPIEKT